jgi:disulfide oxidoreductase YuzD
MSRLEIVLICVSVISIATNIGLYVWLRAALSRLLSFSEEMSDLRDMTGAFVGHVSSVYSLEMFYGDETLQGLMEHARSYKEQLDTFEYIYELSEEEENIDERSPEEEASEEDQE